MNDSCLQINQYLADLSQRAMLPKDIEIGGYWNENEGVTQLENVSDRPDASYLVAADEHLKVVEYASVLWHTHTENGYDCLSSEDVRSARAWQRPHYMYKVSNGESDYYDPCKTLPYTGRRWQWSHSNCWELARDFLRQELGIQTSECWMLNSPEGWADDGWDMWRSHLGDEGFKPVPLADARVGDLAVMSIRCKVPNHCGVIYSVEGNQILHQLSGGLSQIVNFDSKWRDRLYPEKMLWRHRNAPS